MAGRVLFLMLLFTGIWQSVSAQQAANDFALEVEREIASRQIGAVRKGTGEVCSAGELPYWQQLTGAYLSAGRVTEAERLWLDLLKECARHQSYLHPTALQAADGLVRFYADQQQKQKAAALLEELLLAGEKQAGQEEEQLLPLLAAGAGMYGRIGDTAKQEQLLRRALAIVADSNRSSRLDVAAWQLRLADFLLEHEGQQEAEQLYLESAPLLLAELPQQSMQAVELHDRLMQIQLSRHDWAAAEPHIKAVVRYIHDKVGGEHPVYIKSLGRLAFSYAKQGKYTDARQVLEEAIPLAEQLGEEGQELLASLQSFLKELEGERLAPNGAACSEEGMQLYRQQTEDWAATLSRITGRAESLQRKIEEQEAYERKLEEARRAKRDPTPAPGESPEEARERATAHYNRLFVSRLGTWDEAGFARGCLQELAELDQALSRYLAGAQALYQGWDGLVANCSEQPELLETALQHRAFVHDGPLEEFTLRHDLLEPLYADCTHRLVNELWAAGLLAEDEQEFCPNLAAVVEGSALSRQNLQQLEKGELRLLRNAIFAKYGRRFQAADLQGFFYGDGALPCGFYFRTAPDFTDTVLSDQDRANVSLLKAME